MAVIYNARLKLHSLNKDGGLWKDENVYEKSDVFRNLNSKQWYWPTDIYTLVSDLLLHADQTKILMKGKYYGSRSNDS